MHANFTNLLRSSPLVGLWSSKILILKKDRDIRVMERRKHTTANAAMPQKSQGKAETYTGHNLRQRGAYWSSFVSFTNTAWRKWHHFFADCWYFVVGAISTEVGQMHVDSWGRRISIVHGDRVTSKDQKFLPQSPCPRGRAPPSTLNWHETSQPHFL